MYIYIYTFMYIHTYELMYKKMGLLFYYHNGDGAKENKNRLGTQMKTSRCRVQKYHNIS